MFRSFFNKIKKLRIWIHILVSVLSIIWFIFYFRAMEAITTFPDEFEDPFDYRIEFAFYHGAVVFGFLIMIVPQIIIGIKIYKINKNAIHYIVKNKPQ